MCASADIECHVEGQLRLRGVTVSSMSFSTRVGRVEVCYDNRWGIVCANHWSRTEAEVVCRQLGFSKSKAIQPATLNSWSNYTQPDRNTPRWLDNLLCRGSEPELQKCRGVHYGRTSCTQGQSWNAGGVWCSGRVYMDTTKRKQKRQASTNSSHFENVQYQWRIQDLSHRGA